MNQHKKNIIISEYEDDDFHVRHVSETSIANITQTDCIVDLKTLQEETVLEQDCKSKKRGFKNKINSQ